MFSTFRNAVMGRFTAEFRRCRVVCAIAVTCAALLSSPCAVADPALYAMVPHGTGGGFAPAVIDPATGAATLLPNPNLIFFNPNIDLVASAGTLYLQDTTQGGLWEINETTGGLNLVDTGSLLPYADMTVDPLSGKLYAMVPHGTGGGFAPAVIDPATGAATLLPNPNLIFFNPNIDLVASAGTLYLQDTTQGGLWEINETTGGLNLVDTGSLLPYADMTVDPLSGKLYAMVPHGTGGGFAPAVIDPATGAATLLPNPNLIFFNPNIDLVASAGTLYLQDTTQGGLWEINETTGGLNLVDTGSLLPYADMSVAGTGVSQVAEPTTVSLLLLPLAVLIGFGRRRAVTVRPSRLHRLA